MIRQSATPFDHISLNSTYRAAGRLVWLVNDGSMLLPSYQRGDVGTEDQRIALVETWLRGLKREDAPRPDERWAGF
ncbi:hypothetical protein ABZS98_38285 [Streptomyces avermitilis]|uniref:hypothetical protein n=1 Tax=Streptomyces avermitilis TaxID=33903 RepID=UPI0033A9887A